MTLTRREMLGAGGGFAAALTLPFKAARAGEVIEIKMQGREDGSHVWFDPVGILIKPGQTLRWTNLNPGNSHTTTAYNPANFDRPLRMPRTAESWDSDYLLPDESFSVTFTEQGVSMTTTAFRTSRQEWLAASSSANRNCMVGWNRSMRTAICRRRLSTRFRGLKT